LPLRYCIAVIGQLHTQAERIFGEELAVPDEQWQGGPQIASVCAVQSAFSVVQ